MVFGAAVTLKVRGEGKVSSTSAFPHERLLLKAQNLSAVPLHYCGLLLVPVPMGWAVHELLWASFSFGFIATGYAGFLVLGWLVLLSIRRFEKSLGSTGAEAEMVMAQVGFAVGASDGSWCINCLILFLPRKFSRV